MGHTRSKILQGQILWDFYAQKVFRTSAEVGSTTIQKPEEIGARKRNLGVFCNIEPYLKHIPTVDLTYSLCTTAVVAISLEQIRS
jgi:hypothetical protein